jgi:Ca-activated chloride channel family protein
MRVFSSKPACKRTVVVTFLALLTLTVSQSAAAQVKQDDSKDQSKKSQQTQQTQQPPAKGPTQPQQGGAIEDNTPLKISSDLISMNVTVTDSYGRFVSGLPKTAFSLTDDKAPQEITFFSDEDAPVSVGIVFDLTGSMSGDKVRRSKEALSHFLETSHNQDEYFLVTFSGGSTQLSLDKTRDSRAILDKLTFAHTHGTTPFYDACYLGVQKVLRGTHPKRALLVISDGQDNNSRYTFSDLRRLLKESDVIIYSIGIEGHSDGTLGNEGEAILEEISSVSGGKAFFPNSSAEMDDVFERIAVELRHQYAIGYKPNNFTADGKWHRIKVKVSPPRGLPRLFVRSKDGYFALPTPH